MGTLDSEQEDEGFAVDDEDGVEFNDRDASTSAAEYHVELSLVSFDDPTVDTLNKIATAEETPDSMETAFSLFTTKVANLRRSLGHNDESASRTECRSLVRALQVGTSDADISSLSLEESSSEGVSHEVFTLHNGIYRGQVIATVSKREVDGSANVEWRPLGYGTWTDSTAGVKISGLWSTVSISEATRCVGIRQELGLSFEGDWIDASHDDSLAYTQFHGLGVGIFAFGGSFCGEWINSAPCGLGELSIYDRDHHLMQAQRGWEEGITRFQPNQSPVLCDDDDDLQDPTAIVRLARQQNPDQPERGLFLAGEKLERWRIRVLARSVRLWWLYSCQHSIDSAMRARENAINTHKFALKAEYIASSEHMKCLREHQRQADASGMDNLVAESHLLHEKRQKVKKRYEIRYREAEAQLEITRTCVSHQLEAVNMLEHELNATMELLAVAKQAQEDCHAAAHELLTLKRQIENISVQINSARVSPTLNHLSDPSLSRPSSTMSMNLLASRPGTAMSDSSGNVKAISFSNKADILQINDERFAESVCDVPGCECGIPRDVFLRAAAAINGE